MPIRVLLADDHTLVREGLGLILASQGDIEVVGGAASGQEALNACRTLRPDVVIMDIAMPGITGIEATARITGLYPATRIVVLSMHATSEHVYQALRAGATGYLVKESAGSEVAAAVRAAAMGRRYLSRQIAEAVVDDYARLRSRIPDRTPLESLSRREREVLQLVADGRSSSQIAAVLRLSPKTVETYRSRLMHKLGVHDVAGLVKLAVEHGLTTP